MRTRPPTYSDSYEPLEADDWIRSVEKKLNLAQCTNREKVLYVAHQLEGAASEWWENYYAAHEDQDSITWAEFTTAF